ncbi:MAG: Gldg family protein [Verrucomicrobiota bacterium]|jgi:ABC-type uncharacterized transport system involved in gliding motility auxiliary subunit
MKSKNFAAIFYSGVGVAAMFLVLMAFYVLTSAFKQRVDLTQEKAFTLSPGTRHILARLDSPVTLRFYCSQADMPPQLKPFAQEVEDLLDEYKQAGKGNIIVEKYDPIPDSDAEDSARLNGVQGQLTQMGADRVYLGLAVSRADEKQAIPWLDPARERLLEYDVSRAISRVINPTPPTVGVMSALPVFGEESNPMMRQMGQAPSQPWVFLSELKKDFNIVEVPMTAAKIDPDINVLLAFHPRDITEETQFALDQFVMRGGKLIAFLDPHAYFDQRHDQMAQMLGQSSGQSSLPKLLRAWGLDMDINKVVADLNCCLHNPQNGALVPTILLLTKKQINGDDIVTANMDNLELAFAGAFTGKPADGLTETVLAHSSDQSELVDGITASLGADQITRDFKASGVQYALAVRLTGKFKTAFPDGKPKEPGQSGAAASTNAEPSLKESPANGAVILLGDTDCLADQVCVQVRDIMGFRIAQPLNGNLNFLQSCVEQMAGDSDLISLRSRGSLNRPFTRLEELEARAGRQWEAKLKELQSERESTQQKINELQAGKQGSAQQQMILTPEQQKALAKYQQDEAQAGKELRQVQKNLRKDTDSLEAWIRVLNIGAMPALVALSGIVLAVVKHKRTAAK